MFGVFVLNRIDQKIGEWSLNPWTHHDTGSFTTPFEQENCNKNEGENEPNIRLIPDVVRLEMLT